MLCTFIYMICNLTFFLKILFKDLFILIATPQFHSFSYWYCFHYKKIETMYLCIISFIIMYVVSFICQYKPNAFINIFEHVSFWTYVRIFQDINSHEWNFWIVRKTLSTYKIKLNGYSKCLLHFTFPPEV